MAKNEVATIEELSGMYPVLQPDSDVAEILATNLGGDDFSPYELDQIKTPAGGGQAWTLESLDGEDEIVKTVEGIIIFTQMQRAFYESDIDDGGGGNPPDCRSNDTVIGIGEPGGPCVECPYSQYGSAVKGEGQRCKQSRIMYVVRPGQFLPVALKVSASSLKAAKKYLLQLAGRGYQYTSVITSFGLEKDKNADGIAYSRVTFAMVQKLDQTQAVAVKAVSESFKSALG